MHSTQAAALKSRYGKVSVLAGSVLIAFVVGSGCSQAPDAPTPAQQQQSVDSQIQSIQNNPNMPAAAKQQAINGIKAQQSRGSAKP